MKRKSLEKFFNDQLSQWPLACDNFRALKNVQSRQVNVAGMDVRVQFNPVRIVSTAADVREDALRQRRCFLCSENRPKEQISMRFEGRKSKKYNILVNPYPIFPGHIVIASDRHVDQAIWKRYVDMLDIARSFTRYTVFYNGPKCGASAPDHFHFQAALRGNMPLECDVDRVLDRMAAERKDAGAMDMTYVSAVQDAELFHYHGFLHGIFVMRASTVKSAAKMFYRLLDCAPAAEEGGEPMFNLLSWYKEGEYRSVVIFRAAHRPRHYFMDDPERIMVSPGCADMAGVVITPRKEDFDRMTPGLLSEILSDVSLSEEDERKIVWRLTRKQPLVSVGIMSGKEIVFEIISDGAGARSACYSEGKIEYDGALYDELFFEAQTPSMMFAEPTFIIHGVTIGVNFHWERKESQKFAGALKIIVEKDRLTAINVVGVEDYLLSVISSEMKSTSSVEFLKAHAIISRSWVMSMIMKKETGQEREMMTGPDGMPVPSGVGDVPSVISYIDSLRNPGGGRCAGTVDSGVSEEKDCGVERHIRWYDHQEHHKFDVCADDHCQRYQGLTRAAGDSVRRAVDATWGEVLLYDGRLCDARFSKCCGGVTERFSVCWEDRDYPYLQSVRDARGDGFPFCSAPSESVISQVLNDYDRETMDFYRWKVEYGRAELASLISSRLGCQIGDLLALIPLKRGDSGRIYEMKICGTEKTIVVGKELEIRKILSDSHLKSSAFDVEYYDAVGMKVPSGIVEKAAASFAVSGKTDVPHLFDKVVLDGSGWGHGVGLCQIGAAVMASEGYGYREILSHYYCGAVIGNIREVDDLR